MNWDEYFFDICDVVRRKSKDKSTKVGCVIVGEDNGIRSTGYNGFPRGVNDDIDKRYERPLKYKFMEHSERNAIFFAAKTGIPLKNCRLYGTQFPCVDCARAIIQVGIKEVIIDGRDIDKRKDMESRWKDDFEMAKQMFDEANVEYRYYD